MIPAPINKEEFNRLLIARKKKKYAHLATWKELFIFQYTVANRQQLMDIARYAKRKNLGERIELPLMHSQVVQLEMFKVDLIKRLVLLLKKRNNIDK